MNVVPEIPTRGRYAVVGTGRYCAIAWQHGVSERLLVHFLDTKSAFAIARNLNYSHRDKKTGIVSRNWSALNIAWDVDKTSRIILPPGYDR